MRVNEATTTSTLNQTLDRLFRSKRFETCDDDCGVETKCEVPYEDTEDAPKKYYKLTDEIIEFSGHTLHRIQCIEEFVVNNLNLENYSTEERIIKKDELGGFIESEDNLSGDAWVQENAKVWGGARVSGNAIIAGNAEIYGDAKVHGNAIVYDYAKISEHAEIYGKAIIGGEAIVRGTAEVLGKARVDGFAKIKGNARVKGKSTIGDYAYIDDDAEICDAEIKGYVRVESNALIKDIEITNNAKFKNDAYVKNAYDYICFDNVGSRKDTLTAYRTKHEGVRITIGCFFGDLDEFKKDVAKKSVSEALIKREYELISNIIQHRFIDHNTSDYLKNNDKEVDRE